MSAAATHQMLRAEIILGEAEVRARQMFERALEEAASGSGSSQKIVRLRLDCALDGVTLAAARAARLHAAAPVETPEAMGERLGQDVSALAERMRRDSARALAKGFQQQGQRHG